MYKISKTVLIIYQLNVQTLVSVLVIKKQLTVLSTLSFILNKTGSFTLREYHPVEGAIEFDVHTHVCLFALNLEMFDLGHVRGGEGPGIITSTSPRCWRWWWWTILRCWWAGQRGSIDTPMFQRQGGRVQQRGVTGGSLKHKKHR